MLRASPKEVQGTLWGVGDPPGMAVYKASTLLNVLLTYHKKSKHIFEVALIIGKLFDASCVYQRKG